MSVVDEDARRRFESDWMRGEVRNIRDYLPEESSGARLGTLEELVCIDMEFHWAEAFQAVDPTPSLEPFGTVKERNISAPLLETYLEEFPELSEPAVLQRLVNQEIWARGAADTKGTIPPPQASEYERRFPQLKVPTSAFGRIIASRETLPLDGSSSVSANDGELPRQAGEYELLQVLGRGGMGTVYRARHRSTGREVAWKIANISSLPASLRSEARSRVMQEIRLSAKLSHDHIVPVHDVGEMEGQPFYTMPVIDTDLGTEVQQRPLDGKKAAKYIAQAARGIQAAHDAGLLHRDIKPHNLMLDRSRDRILVADFGLARCTEDPRELTLTGQVLGTPPYMPPEQIQNAKSIDERADVYSLGAALYHLLTGRPPFVASEAAETLRLVLQEDPLPPRQQNTTVDLDLDTICIKCLHKEPSLRYSSAAELADDLERFLDGQPIQARQLSSLGRLARWQRRNPGLARLTAALAGSLTLLAIVSLIGWLTAQNLLSKTRVLLGRVMDNNRQGQVIVGDLFAFIRTDPTLDQPGGETIRRKMLERGVQHYQTLATLAEENTSLLPDQFIARVQIGLLTADLDGPQPAHDEFVRALEIHESLHADQQEKLRVQTALGDALNGLATAQRRLRDLDAAYASFSKTIQVREDLVSRKPLDIEMSRKLANAKMNQGLVLAAKGRLETASLMQIEAQVRRKELLVKFADNRFLQRDQAMGQYNLAMLSLTQQDLSTARVFLDDAISSFRVLTRQHATDWRLWLRLVQCLMTSSVLDRQLAQHPNSGEALHADLITALDYLEKLASFAPNDRSYRLQLIDLSHQAVDQCLDAELIKQAGEGLQKIQVELLSHFEEDDLQPDIASVRLEQRRLLGLQLLASGNHEVAAPKLRKVLADWDVFHNGKPTPTRHSMPEEPSAWSALREMVRGWENP